MSSLAWQIPVCFLVFNAVWGLALAEYCFQNTKRHREVNEERDSRFPAWRRLDNGWMKRIYVYPMAATIGPLRIQIFLILYFTFYFVAQISHLVCYFGKTDKRGCPNSCVQRLLGVICYLILLNFGFVT